jgi:hypothetical protein
MHHGSAMTIVQTATLGVSDISRMTSLAKLRKKERERKEKSPFYSFQQFTLSA